MSDQLKGALYGLLIGDALGVPYEFKPPAEIPPSPEIEYTPPPHFPRSHPSVQPGTWSDDGSQALCLLESLLARGELNLIDFSQRLQNWYFEGHLAVDKNVFDVGIQTREAIIKLSKNFFPGESGRADEHANGNGSLMRCLPLALWHRGTDAVLVEDAHQQSIITHAHPRAQACCALYCLWARRILQSDTDPWQSATATLRLLYQNRPDFTYELEDHIRPESPPICEGTGYVVDCLHSARIACRQDSFEAVVKRAIAFGNDTDTTACVAGGIAGLRFGFSQIPARFIQNLRGQSLFAPLLTQLLTP
ncbi:ADP-ribosylglycohydrolase superfamily [Verrucomicrobiia bacterium DG1235]|nr:ADP-ribosylglycohydrolase superfamily [Verrucomicrobiae bacterium DG1235]